MTPEELANLRELVEKYNDETKKELQGISDTLYNHRHTYYDKTKAVSVNESGLDLSDLTTDDVSITKHGFAPKAPNDSTKFLNGVGAWAVPPDTVGLTTSFDYQLFTTTGANTWTKPATALSTSLVYVQLWAGGGGGGGQNIASDIASGGGGGEYQEMFILASQLGSTVAITIGAGGIGGNNASGLIGTASTFGSFVRAEPGGGGAGTTEGAGGKFNIRDVNSGGDGGDRAANGQDAVKGGGGGSGSVTGGGLNGGTSKLGGNGGSAPSGNGAGQDGSAPAGGGSATTRLSGSGNLKGGDGARGECRVWTFF